MLFYSHRVISKLLGYPFTGKIFPGAAYSTSVTNDSNNDKYKISPWFVTGFTDGEGSFILNVSRTTLRTVGWKIEGFFSIAVHKKDRVLLENIKGYLGVSANITQEGEKVKLRMSAKQDLQKIMAHFDKYPLITQKLADYLLWRKAMIMVFERKHLSMEGLCEIVGIKSSLNLGLSPVLQEGFPETLPCERPLVVDQVIPSEDWVVGFVSAEGCFFVTKHRSSRLGWKVGVAFILTQHNRDEVLMRTFVDYFGCGSYYPHSTRDIGEYKCQDFHNNYNKIQQFFLKYPLLGSKLEDFKDWCLVLELIKNNAHLTQEGLDIILNIKNGMNTGRS